MPLAAGCASEQTGTEQKHSPKVYEQFKANRALMDEVKQNRPFAARRARARMQERQGAPRPDSLNKRSGPLSAKR